MPGYSSRKRRLESDRWDPERERVQEGRVQKRHRHDNETYGGGAGRSYRPSYDNDRGGRYNHVGSSRPGRPFRPEQPNHHRKNYRENNPSTRIRSLRKQLTHQSAATLPADLLAEKERELSYLESTQKQAQTKTSRSQAIRKYHMVRFFERTKAQRNLKRMRKQASADSADNESPLATEEDIHRAETDVIYTMYTPLAEKYFAIFASNEAAAKNPNPNPKKRRGEPPPQGDANADDGAKEVVKLSDTTTKDFRPAQWYTIHTILQKYRPPQNLGADDEMADPPPENLVKIPGENKPDTAVSVTSAQLQELEALRDGKAAAAGSIGASFGMDALPTRSKKRAAASSQGQNGVGEDRPAWQMATDDAIDPMDADSDSDQEDGGMAVGGDVDGNESDGDGGFFE